MTNQPWIPLLTGVVGSYAYGLDTPQSDVDMLSMALAPSRQFFGLTPPVSSAASRVSTNPDVTVHEVGKFLSLCLSANPTVTELLWLPSECYEHMDPAGADLIENRGLLLGARQVRNSYLGYATSQFAKLQRRGDSFSSDTNRRTAKHARHLMRLLTQGVQLYTTGQMSVRVSNPEEYHAFGDLVATNPEEGIRAAQRKLAHAEEAFDRSPSALNDEPNRDAAEAWLIHTREQFLNGEES